MKSIEVKEGLVRRIRYTNTKSVKERHFVWRRPLSYPAMGFIIQHPFKRSIATDAIQYCSYQSAYNAIDAYGINYALSNINKRNTTTDFYHCYQYLFIVPDREEEEIPGILGRKSTSSDKITLIAYRIDNDTQLENFPIGANKVPDAEWSFSDEETGQIVLYATPYNEIDYDYNLDFPATYDLGSMYHDGKENYFVIRKHDTDITVAAGTPLITLSSKKGSTVQIKSILTNFNDYKQKYETACGSTFPKSTYPYLRGFVKLNCKSNSLGIDTANEVPNKLTAVENAKYIGGMYLVFHIAR